MAASNSTPSSLLSLAKKIGATALMSAQNRGELLLVELREEQTRLIELLIWVAAVGFLGVMFVLTLTAAVIYLFPEPRRVYAAMGFSAFYLLGTVLALLNLKAILKSAKAPFPDSLDEIRKDRAWLESLKERNWRSGKSPCSCEVKSTGRPSNSKSPTRNILRPWSKNASSRSGVPAV